MSLHKKNTPAFVTDGSAGLHSVIKKKRHFRYARAQHNPLCNYRKKQLTKGENYRPVFGKTGERSDYA